MGTDIVLRPGRLEDAEALATLHVEVWRETYAHLAPPDAYLALDEAKRMPYWQRTLSSGDPMTGAIVATDGSAPLAVAAFGPSSNSDMAQATEIKHCYVRRSARGTGLGKRILLATFDALRSEGCDTVWLAFVEENTAARNFYRAMGGREVGRFIDPGPLWRSSNCIVTWTFTGEGHP